MSFFRKLLLLFSAFALILPCFGQKVMVIYKPGTDKRFLYSVNDPIYFSLGKHEYSVNDKIKVIGDSNITVLQGFTVPYSKIQVIYRQRLITKKFIPAFYLAGAGYFGLTFANRLLNRETPLMDKGTSLSAAALLSAAVLLRAGKYKVYSTANGWRIKVLDYSQFNTSGLPSPH